MFPVSQALSSPGRRSPLPPRSWGSRRSSWNSLGRAPSLKRRDTSGERESLLSGEGGEEDSGEHVAEVAANNRLWPEPLELLQASTLCPTMVAESGDCNGRTLTYDPNGNSDTKDDSSPEEDMDDDVCWHTFDIYVFISSKSWKPSAVMSGWVSNNHIKKRKRLDSEL